MRENCEKLSEKTFPFCGGISINFAFRVLRLKLSKITRNPKLRLKLDAIEVNSRVSLYNCFDRFPNLGKRHSNALASEFLFEI